MSRSYIRGHSEKVLAADTLDAIQVITNSVPPINSQGNLSSGVTTSGIDEKSSSVDTQHCPHISIFGEVDQACVISVEQSADNTNWYNNGHSYTAVGAEDFFIEFTGGARYYRVSYDVSGTTVTACLSAKR